MDSEIANRYFQGKENVAMAIARRRIKTSGNVKKALALVPITKPLSDHYRDMIEAEYPRSARRVAGRPWPRPRSGHLARSATPRGLALLRLLLLLALRRLRVREQVVGGVSTMSTVFGETA